MTQRIGPDRSPEAPLWLIVGVLIVCLAVLFIVDLASTPRRAPESPVTVEPSIETGDAGLDGSTQELAGASPASAAGMPAGRPFVPVAGASEAGGAPLATRYRGTATWYCSETSTCTRGYGPQDLVAAIDTDLGFSKGDRVVVRFRDRSVTVRIVDVCACPGERLIDLTSGAFRRLAPLGYGVLPVTVELAGSRPTLPPTETLP